MRVHPAMNLRVSVFLCVFLTSVLPACGQTAYPAKDWATVQNILKGIHGVSTAPPKGIVTPKYTAGALMGNGEIGVVAGDTTTSQRFYFGKTDFWGTHWNAKHNRPEVSILSLGHLTISSPARTSGADAVYRMDQDILNAQVLTTLKMGNAIVHMQSWTADGEDIFITRVSTGAGSPDVPLQLSLAMPTLPSDAHTVYPQATGERDGVLWASRENNLTGATDYHARVAIAVRLLGAKLSEPVSGKDNIAGKFDLK